MPTELTAHIQVLLEKNRRHVGEFQFTVPSPISYPYQWLWDSCFHAIILCHFDPDAAAAELRSLVARQHPNGMIGHITYWQPHEVILNIDWGLDHTSNLIQPPLLAEAVWRVYERTANTQFLAELYPALRDFYTYILRERIITSRGLCGLINPDESGEDNSPRFDAAQNLPPHHSAKINTEKRYELFHTHRQCNFHAACTSEHFWVEDVPFNAILIHNLTALSDIAHTLGEVGAARAHQQTAQNLKEALRTHSLIDGRFHSLSGREGTPITVETTALFIPLYAGLYSHQEATTLITTTLLHTQKFWLSHGIPTVARDAESYNASEPTWGEAWQRPHWRGPAWMAMHWFIFHGLIKYGFTKEATELREKSLALISEHGFREYFDADTGVGMGADDFTWGGLIIDMQSPSAT